MDLLVDRIQRIPLRDVWKHEAHHFTTWLADHLDVLSEVVEPDLTFVEREASAGSFSVDILAEDASGDSVIIENQLGRSDHDHLGKMLTYLAAFEAQTAIWIVGEPRPEHTKAIAWLNDTTSAKFFLLRAEAVRIGDSPAALLLTPIVWPGETAGAVAHEKKEKAERHLLRKNFFSALLELANHKTKLHSNVSASDQNWLPTSAGRSGFSLTYVIKKDCWRVELYIDVGDAELNTMLFDELSSHRMAVEKEFGDPTLDWQRMDDKKGCRLTTPWLPGGYRSPEHEWPHIHSQMADAMVRLEAAVTHRVQALPELSTLRANTAAATE